MNYIYHLHVIGYGNLDISADSLDVSSDSFRFYSIDSKNSKYTLISATPVTKTILFSIEKNENLSISNS